MHIDYFLFINVRNNTHEIQIIYNCINIFHIMWHIFQMIIKLILFFSQSQWYYCNCTPSFIFEINKSKKWNFVLLLMSLSQIVYLFIGFKWWTCSFKFINQIWNFNNPCWNHWLDLGYTFMRSWEFCNVLFYSNSHERKQS